MAKPVTTLVVIAFTALVAIAQSPQENPTEVRLSGRINVGGQPLEKGRILLYNDENQIVGCVFKDGKYTIKNPQRGTFRVTIDGSNVSKRYSDFNKPQLKIELREGTNVMDFDLAPGN